MPALRATTRATWRSIASPWCASSGTAVRQRGPPARVASPRHSRRPARKGVGSARLAQAAAPWSHPWHRRGSRCPTDPHSAHVLGGRRRGPGQRMDGTRSRRAGRTSCDGARVTHGVAAVTLRGRIARSPAGPAGPPRPGPWARRNTTRPPKRQRSPRRGSGGRWPNHRTPPQVRRAPVAAAPAPRCRPSRGFAAGRSAFALIL